MLLRDKRPDSSQAYRYETHDHYYLYRQDHGRKGAETNHDQAKASKERCCQIHHEYCPSIAQPCFGQKVVDMLPVPAKGIRTTS